VPEWEAGYIARALMYSLFPPRGFFYFLLTIIYKKFLTFPNFSLTFFGREVIFFWGGITFTACFLVSGSRFFHSPFILGSGVTVDKPDYQATVISKPKNKVNRFAVPVIKVTKVTGHFSSCVSTRAYARILYIYACIYYLKNKKRKKMPKKEKKKKLFISLIASCKIKK
jgi:hypothetical protein